ncbi:MAG: ABC transporter permease [Ignavibacteriales bacterium]|nr:ABC transporter permease [Ignavibacteriales bacterium]
MSLLLKLGWRNIWRNKRRSIITILAVTFAVMLSIAMRGIQLGTYDVNIRHVVELFAGYIQIQVPGYQKNPTLQKSFSPTDRLLAFMRSDSRIVGSAPRIVGDGLVSLRDKSQGALLFGVSPNDERLASKLMGRVVHGRFLLEGQDTEVVVGDKLFENLSASIGEQIVVLAQGYDGSLGNLKFTIVGTVKTGMPEFDQSSVFMTLPAAQELLVMDGKVSVLTLRLRDLSEIDPVKESLREPLGEGLVALSWKEVLPDFDQSIQLDNVSGMLTLAILIIVVAFGITNTVLMSVTERFREFGIILSVGMQPKKLVVLVFLETMIIVLIGLILGNVLAAGINLYIMNNPIVFSGDFEQMYAEYGFLPRLESTLRLSSFLNISLSVLGISVIAMFYPIAKVIRLEPLKGIRHT